MNEDEMTQAIVGLMTYFLYNNNVEKVEASVDMLVELQDMGFFLKLERNEETLSISLCREENVQN